MSNIDDYQFLGDKLSYPNLLNEETLFNAPDPFSRPIIDNYCSEREAKIYLTREDILELGFLRSNPDRKIYVHKDKPTLILHLNYTKNYAVKDLVEELTVITGNPKVLSNTSIISNILYKSTKPNKEDIQQVINNYAT